MVTQEIPMKLNPAWLDSPPDTSFPNPPTLTRAQTLPYHKLSWENFERLILRIVRREATVAECWTYGERGQKQYGLDILAELRDPPGVLACYQCKNVTKFTESDINNAVTKFLKGKWAVKTNKFILCISLQLTKTEQVDEILRQRNILATKGIDFETWDGSESGRLSEYLKKHPDLVDDFFLREWVRVFNGQEAENLLGQRLDGGNLAELRKQLLGIYSTLFHRYDQGIRLGFSQTTPILDRYVTPTVIETRQFSQTERIPSRDTENFTGQHPSENTHQQTSNRSSRSTTIQQIRMPIGDWLSRHNRSVILGEPGYGKSVLLRVAALQLLNGLDEPFFNPWHGLLPVWISFGGFSAAVQRQDGLSLEDYFEQWLHQHGADSIRPLFRRAFKQGKITLLIDGLDEGQDLHVAQRAMDILDTYLAIRSIPAIFTSRPRGYMRVKLGGAWPLARMASFDEAQIERFARTWFKHLEPPEIVSEKGYAWAEASADQRKEEFLKAIRANPRVMELARTPLLCQLLIDIFRFSHHLPEQSTKVYNKVIELLLSVHPAARIQAAGLPSSETARTDDMREMLMGLALHIQIHGGTGVISSNDCQAVFCNFLTDDIDGPGYSPYEARHQAKSAIEYAQTGLGLVVERAPHELGFFHLTVQEYLAAQAMVRREENEQLDWLADVWNQSRWHEVVLFWFSIMGLERGKGITQRAIDHLKQTATGPLAELQLLQLRTELAAGDLGLSPREARITIEESANQVEITPFPELRQALAQHITLGLRSHTVAKQCEDRIFNWVPARSEWERARLLEVFGTWQMSEDLLHTLKLALHDESGRCRWAAAGSLARVFASDSAVGEHLAILASRLPDTSIRAAALHGLWKGWPQHEALNELADAACQSNDMNLALTGIALRVETNRHDTKDRQKIWFMLSHGTVSYEMRDYCRRVLVKGWGNDKDIKRVALEAIRNRRNQGRIFGEEEIIAFLAQSWPGDSDVGCCIADWLEGSSGSFLLEDHEKWRILYENFRGHKELSSILKRILLDRESRYKNIYWGPDTRWAYCVIGNDAAKKEVLEAYNSVERDIEKLWVISTLMEAWPDDSEVRSLLSQEFERPPGEVPFLSSCIDDFVSNPKKRRSWLFDALKHGNRRSVMAPIRRILEEFEDEECLKAVLAVLENDIWYYDKIAIQNCFIEKFPLLPEARQWAEASFSEIDGTSIASVATGYQNDPTIRARVLRSARPAKTDVRSEVFRVFHENSIPKDSGLRLTEYIWTEEKSAVRSAGVVARCIMASQNQDLIGPLATKLREEIKSFGTYYEMRRRSAFAGLLELREYDACVESLTEEKTPSLSWLTGYLDPDIIVVRMLFEHWDKLNEAAQAQSRPFQVPSLCVNESETLTP